MWFPQLVIFLVFLFLRFLCKFAISRLEDDKKTTTGTRTRTTTTTTTTTTTNSPTEDIFMPKALIWRNDEVTDFTQRTHQQSTLYKSIIISFHCIQRRRQGQRRRRRTYLCGLHDLCDKSSHLKQRRGHQPHPRSKLYKSVIISYYQFSLHTTTATRTTSTTLTTNLSV